MCFESFLNRAYRSDNVREYSDMTDRSRNSKNLMDRERTFDTQYDSPGTPRKRKRVQKKKSKEFDSLVGSRECSNVTNASKDSGGTFESKFEPAKSDKCPKSPQKDPTSENELKPATI